MVTSITRPHAQAESDIPISQMMVGGSAFSNGIGCLSQSRTCIIQDGLELFYWKGCFEEMQAFPLFDDRDRLCFSFNSCISGGARCLFEDGPRREYEICDKSGTIQYGPGRKGVYQQQGEVENLAVMVHPDLFATWAGEEGADLKNSLAAGGRLDGYRGGELLALAQVLRRALAPREGAGPAVRRHPLWLQAQCMAFVSLFLEPSQPAPRSCGATSDHKRLLRARDMLLMDLSRAPSLDHLAREAGLSVPTLTRGFRRLFGASPFALFQRERMEAARVRLTAGRESVMRIAADLGYTNASHFADAFRRQFGFLPGDIKRQRRGQAEADGPR